MARLHWPRDPWWKSWLALVLVMWWGSAIFISGILLSLAYGGVFVLLWIAGNLYLGYRFNEARQHADAPVLDDRVPLEERDAAENYFVAQALEDRNRDEARKRKEEWKKNHHNS